MRRAHAHLASLLCVIFACGVATANASPGKGRGQSPTTKAKQLLTKARLAKAKQIQGRESAATAYTRGDTNVEISIGPVSDGDLALWTVRTTRGGTTKEATSVVDAAFPYATRYSEHRKLANGDHYSETGDATRIGYEGVAEADKPVDSTVTQRLTRTTSNDLQVSVEQTFRFGKRWRDAPPAARRLQLTGQGAVASFDLAEATPVLKGNVTELARRADGEIRAFISDAVPDLAAESIEAIIAAIATAPSQPIDGTPKATVRAMWQAAMAGW